MNTCICAAVWGSSYWTQARGCLILSRSWSTTTLLHHHSIALIWAQQPVDVQPAHWAQRLSFVRGFACHRSATDPRTQIPPRLAAFRPKRARRTCTRTMKFESYCALLSTCLVVNAANCDLGLTLSVRTTECLRPPSRRSAQSRASGCGSYAAVLTIRSGKFGKFDSCLCTHRLAKYLPTTSHDANAIGRRPVSSYLFVSNWAIVWMAARSSNFLCLVRQIGLRVFRPPRTTSA